MSNHKGHGENLLKTFVDSVRSVVKVFLFATDTLTEQINLLLLIK